MSTQNPSLAIHEKIITRRRAMLENIAKEKLGITLETRNSDSLDFHDLSVWAIKMTDSRFEGYSAVHGDKSWELDALDPKLIGNLIIDEVSNLIDHEKWALAEAREKKGIAKLTAFARKGDV